MLLLLQTLIILLMTSSMNGFVIPSSFAASRHESSSLFMSVGGDGISRKKEKEQINMTPAERRRREIQQKIQKFRREGRLPSQKPGAVIVENEDTSNDSIMVASTKRLKKSNVMDDYGDKLRNRLGRRSVYLGISPTKKNNVTDEEEGVVAATTATQEEQEEEELTTTILVQDDEDETKESIVNQEELVEMVAQKLKEQRKKERKEQQLLWLQRQKKEAQMRMQQTINAGTNTTSKSTSGVGGNWIRNETAAKETYKPVWGCFDRPKDISRAFGGGRRIGKTTDAEEEESYTTRVDRTLKEYRLAVGIDSPLQDEHEEEINTALQIARLGMDRGQYSTSVSALEKVSCFCSSNSKVGAQVFLELGMAYEAADQKPLAQIIYRKLSKSCLVEEVKRNAKQLLFRLDSADFMENSINVKSDLEAELRRNFEEAMGRTVSVMDDIEVRTKAKKRRANEELTNFEAMSQNIVRTTKEAMQVLKIATTSIVGTKQKQEQENKVEGKEEIAEEEETEESMEQAIQASRMKKRQQEEDIQVITRDRIVQACRFIERGFDISLQEEIDAAIEAARPVAIMDGQPIKIDEEVESKAPLDFHLVNANDTKRILNGDWRLHLLADEMGDGVEFMTSVNTTLVSTTNARASTRLRPWKLNLDLKKLQFQSVAPMGPVLELNQYGSIDFMGQNRTLRRRNVRHSNLVLSNFEGTGILSSKLDQQVLMIEQDFMLTRCVVKKNYWDSQSFKNYFGVWRRQAVV